jgi:hypothetical protein
VSRGEVAARLWILVDCLESGDYRLLEAVLLDLLAELGL